MRKKCRYYLFDGVLYEKVVNSKEVYNHAIPSQAIPVLELFINKDGLKLKKLQGWDPSLECQAILMFYNMWDYNESSKIILPEELIDTISRHVDDSIKNIIRKYDSFSSEDMITAVLGERLYEEFEQSDINVNIQFQSYSSVKKEPVNGADLSFIFDIKDRAGQRVIKTILVQSKKIKDLIVPKKIPRLDDQIEKMSKITDENYVFLYSKNGFNTFKSSTRDKKQSVSDLFGDILRCQSGDRKKSVLASALDSKYIIYMSVIE
ncbi:TPA: hypothetical protein ACSTLU_001000 [Serratia fonticola]